MATYTVAQRDGLAKALATGVLRVSHEGRSVEYRTLADVQRALAVVEAGLIDQGLVAAPVVPPVRRLRIVTNKGLR